VLELYHSINSVCAQKVRIALKERGQEAKDHIMTLRGDQYEPAYLKLNPSGVVPTLIHDGSRDRAGGLRRCHSGWPIMQPRRGPAPP
jgi:glutathione S-transferase